jgi:AraC-like DNA-binding protein
MTVDVLSDVLRAVRLTGAVYFDIRARAPWVAETPATSRFRAKVMPEFEHVIAFHIIMDGWCWVYLSDQPDSAIRLETGDAVIIAGGESHIMGTERTKPEEPDLGKFYRPGDRPLPFVFNELGGQGDPFNLVCGYFGCDAQPFNPILDALPRMLHVRGPSFGGTPVKQLIGMALRESEKPSAGGETILARLSELLFLQSVRDYIERLPAEATGWLSALRDRHIGAALRHMHARPAHRWTVDELAREVGVSRSALAERFNQVVGTPPMQYLGSWRLQLAAQQMLARGLGIAQAAAEVGYESEAAFNRAFKRQVGMSPGSWRRSKVSAPH